MSLLAALIMTGAPLLAAEEPYKGFAEDAKLLRDTALMPSDGKQLKFSSGKAQEASRKIFSKIAFLYKTRAEVLELLGDPATINDVGEKPGPEKDSPLVYRFDNGFGGPNYRITFENGVVIGVTLVQGE